MRDHGEEFCRFEDGDALSALREAAYGEGREPVGRHGSGEEFVASTMARWRAAGLQRRLRYWAPALVAGLAAAVWVLATVQLSLTREEREVFRPGVAEARLDAGPVIPGYGEDEGGVYLGGEAGLMRDGD